MDQAGNIDGVKIGLKCFIIFKTSHALCSVKPEVVKDLYIKLIYLVQKDREVFIQAFSEEYTTVQQDLCLLRFV